MKTCKKNPLTAMAFYVFCFLPVATWASAEGLEMMIVPPATPVISGQVSVFYVYVHNFGEEALSVVLPDQLSCFIEASGRRIKVTAKAIAPMQKAFELQKGGFLKRSYSFTAPDDIAGTVQFQVSDLNASSIMFAVVPSDKDVIRAETGLEPSEEYPSMGSLFSLYQVYLVNLAAYEPMYFLVGTDPNKSKFQLSFKYRLFNPEGTLAKKIPGFKGLHFGYTQTSYWDLKSDSAPFEDTSYKPELFYLSPNLSFRPSWMTGLFLQGGMQHESNGRGGEFSRSTNYGYLKPSMIFYDPETQYGLQVSPKIWGYVHNDEGTNPDLYKYKGYFELETKVGKADGLVLGSYLRWAQKGGSIQVDLTYPISRLLFSNIDVYFHAQYVNALAENLVDYQSRTHALRLGVSLVR